MRSRSTRAVYTRGSELAEKTLHGAATVLVVVVVVVDALRDPLEPPLGDVERTT